VLSGLLLYLAFPPVRPAVGRGAGVALLALVCTGCTARQGALLGLLHGTALFLVLVEWTAELAGWGRWSPSRCSRPPSWRCWAPRWPS
jgi:apolipoprotein N-acyltransferase